MLGLEVGYRYTPGVTVWRWGHSGGKKHELNQIRNAASVSVKFWVFVSMRGFTTISKMYQYTC